MSGLPCTEYRTTASAGHRTAVQRL